MPKYVRDGVLARPGVYKYGDVSEEKSAAELKAAVERQPSIMLTIGHPKGDTSSNDVIGRVDQSWDSEQGLVRGRFIFYDGEHWDRVPEGLRDKIVNNRPIQVSSGFRLEGVEDGIQMGILYDHVALLRDTEDPICPLGQCGISIRRESSEMQHRYEQASDVGETNTTAPAEEVSSEKSSEMTELRAEMAAMKELIISLKAESVREPEPVETPPVVATPVPEVTKAEAPPVPSTIIPAGFTESDGLLFNESGHLVIETKAKARKYARDR